MTLASRLTERVRIERPSGTSDGYGGNSVTWVELASVFAEVSPVYGAIHERALAEQRVANAGYRVIIRLRQDVTAAMRIHWKNRVLLIHSLHETQSTLNMLCYEENV